MQQKENKRRFRLVIYLYMLIILLSLLTVASYTWFSISQTPRVSDLYMYVNSPKGLEIALRADAPDEEWLQQLDYRDMVSETAPLRPVTWSEKAQRFYAANYGVDGRMTGKWAPLSDDVNANRNTYFGYYIKATFYARTDANVKVFLSPAVEVDEGINSSGTYLIGTPLWNSQELLHSNGGQGAECAVRVGLRVTPLSADGVPDPEAAVFKIYEPNSDVHIDGTKGYQATPSIDGTPHLINQENIILQSASSWTEAYPVQRDVVIKELGEFTTENTQLFTLKSGETVKIDVYIWLEGQDVDCTNRIEAAQILASIQFRSESDNQSGMTPIDETEPGN